MGSIETLVIQTEDAYAWTNKLINSIPHDRWDTTPEVIDSNVTWQVGHLLMSEYYHSIRSIRGHHPEIVSEVPLKKYAELFADTSPLLAVGKINPLELHNHLTFVQKISVEVINSLTINDLESDLAAARTPNPVAKNKFEAIDWNIKHTLWHCGQLALLKRIVHERYDFGLRKK